MAMDRRGFLGTLALVPSALAACAGGSAASGGRTSTPGGPAREGADAAEGSAAFAAVRSFPLPAEAEPAFVFRAAAARPAER